MAEPFLGEIRIMSFSFAPRSWALCNGQLLPINQNQALFSLLGTTYGGDGRTTFALPNSQGRTPIHTGQGHSLGERGGEQNHTLNLSEMPTHTHPLVASGNTAGLDTPNASAVMAVAGLNLYREPTALATMEPTSISNAGGSQPHVNMQPYLTLNFCIALQGIFPSQN